MRNKFLLLVVCFLIPFVIISFNKDKTNFYLSENDELINVKVKNSNNNEIINLELEDYIIGVVAAEMPASFEIEALKAQAVAARTYAMNKIENSQKEYDLVTDVTNQSYITIEEMKMKWGNDYERYYDKIKSAVNDTKGKVLKYKDKVIEAYYFSMSNGYTEEASLVFGESKPYLESVDSKWDNNDLAKFYQEITYSKKEFCELLKITCEDIVINDIERSSTNRVNKIIINNQTFIGTEVRKKLKLRSTDFDITLLDNVVLIATNGYGHGVGMSQYGANGMAKSGYDYEDILYHYYQNVAITKI